MIAEPTQASTDAYESALLDVTGHTLANLQVSTSSALAHAVRRVLAESGDERPAIALFGNAPHGFDPPQSRR